MQTDHDTTNLDVFYDLLAQERDLLLRGEIEMLTRLLPRKERLLDCLQEGDLTPSVIEDLRASFDQNQQLLRAVLEGLRAASTRLKTIERGNSSLKTYTENGSSSDLSRKECQFEIKA